MPPSPEIEITHHTFDAIWSKLNEDQKILLLKSAQELAPSLAVLPALEGVLSYQFEMRSLARTVLNQIIQRIQGLLALPEDKENYAAGIRESARVGAKVFQQIRPGMRFDEQSYLFKLLLELGERGAGFAFKALLLGSVSEDTVQKILYTASDILRLNFTGRYINESPEVRLAYAELFKPILKRVQSRETVIRYYAGLFDLNQDADPFLNHIKPRLRSADSLLENEAASNFPAVKAVGLKALAVMADKIPWQVLAGTLENQDVKKLRTVVYQIVENSAVGVYPQMFDPILKQLDTCDPAEGGQCFKALVVTGKMPPRKVICLIREQHPELLPAIHEQISQLSRISFMVIQDIALNQEWYLEQLPDTNLACVLGMVRKRPERVARAIAENCARNKEALNPDTARFLEKARTLLAKEKRNIEQAGASFLGKSGQPAKAAPKTRRFSLLKSPEEKRLKELRNPEQKESLDFKGQVIEGEDLSNRTFSGAPVFFSDATLKNCDLSGSYFRNVYFKNCILINVNLDQAMFESIEFDNAVMIRTKARKSVFKNCCFQGADLIESDFSHAVMTGCLFIDAKISRARFSLTQLNYADFSNARISGVSFLDACLEYADFYGAMARFSRFPPHLTPKLRSQDMRFNARRYQPDLSDLPHIENEVVKTINQLIFCEFIHHGERMFFKQNQLSLLTAYDIFRPVQADFFQAVPFLLHENIEFSGLQCPDPGTPCGIADYQPPPQIMAVLEKYADKQSICLKKNASPRIEGVFTMGSIGSVAQTRESDIDYWVCIYKDRMTSAEISLLETKLSALETLAKEKFRISVTFFLVDILSARNNDFGGFSSESSGSAQARLLKEEFYRTMIQVAGRLPLWAVLPTAVSLNYYNLINERTGRISAMARYIDLGDIHAIPVNEYFGASMWQMFKWLKSPFKSIIKMALLEKYIASYGKEFLLCNQYKNEWMNAGTRLLLTQNDSYIILLNHLQAFYSRNSDIRSVNLILTCFFLKLEITDPKEIEGTSLGLRRIILDKCLSTWGWSQDKMIEIGRFRQWKYASLRRLSETLEKYMLEKYQKVHQEFKSSSQGQMISESDRSILERKVQVEFQDKPFKIKKLLLVSRRHRHFPKLYIRCLPGPKSAWCWELFYTDTAAGKRFETPLIICETIEEMGAWIISNQLYKDPPMINLIPNPTPVTHDAIKKLYDAMNGFFAKARAQTSRFTDLERVSPSVVCLFVSINFYTDRYSEKVMDYGAVYLNDWGEMFCMPHKEGKVFSNLDFAKKDILVRMGLTAFPKNTLFFSSKVRMTG